MKKILCLSLLLVLLSACGARTPSKVKTSHLAEKYFHKYAKKYPTTEFASDKIISAETQEVRELQKNLATSLTMIKLQNGSEISVLLTLLRKAPAGWRITSWEKVQRE